MSENKTLSTIAKIIRIITVPPILILSLLLVLFFFRPEMFSSFFVFFLLVYFLVLVPLMAYPITRIIISKSTDRSIERKFAFILSLIGYIGAVISSFVVKADKCIVIICISYLLSVIVLTFFNKILHIKASGHACSATAPLVFLVLFVNYLCIIPAIIIAAASVWASLYLKRHTAKELCIGSLINLISIAAVYVPYLIVSANLA